MSKLSLHISDWMNPDAVYDFIEATRPPLVKVFGNVGLNDSKIREALNRSPSTVFVGRMYFPEQIVEKDETSPVDSVFNYDAVADARQAFEQMREITEKLRGLVTIWEGYNEVPVDSDQPLTDRNRQRAKNYNAFTVEMARLMHEQGFKYAAYSFSTGNPVHIELWDLMVEGLRASDYLALHEYIAPNEQWTDFNKGMCNRYRGVYTRIPADARKPVLITECGADYIGTQGFMGRINANRYLDLMREYDANLMNDPYVVGATVFCYGIDNSRWKTYNIAGEFAQRMREYILQTPTPPIEPPQVMTPPKPESPVQPEAPAQPALARVEDILATAQQAKAKLDAGDADAAHTLLHDTIIPWFYASAPNHSTDLVNAQAQTAARWFAEEATRDIEQGKTAEASQLLANNVIAWLASPGPRALGILAADEKPAAKAKTTRKPKAQTKPPAKSTHKPKGSSLVLGEPDEPTKS